MGVIQLKTKPSRTLFSTGVKDIGLRSESHTEGGESSQVEGHPHFSIA